MRAEYASTFSPPRRRLGGWGFEGHSFPPSPELLAWLAKRLGETRPFPAFDPHWVLNPTVPLDPTDRLEV